MATTGASSSCCAVEGVSVFYKKFRAIDHVDIASWSRGVVSIIGANGAGKSTLLKAIIGQADQVEGRLSLTATTISDAPTAKPLSPPVSCLVPEGARLFSSLTVEENLRLGWDVGRRGEIGFADVWRLFPILQERRQQKAGSLSGGQQQMVALGRDAARRIPAPSSVRRNQPRFWHRSMGQRALHAHSDRSRAATSAILIVEQDIERSLTVADRFYCLLEGKVSLSGRPAEVTRDTRHETLFRPVSER